MKSLYLIDASGYIYRSYFAIRQMTNQRGESTNALFGFIRSLLKLIKDFSPTHLVSVFDGPNNSANRIALYAEYKAHRQKTPPDLIYQIEWAKEFCQFAGIPLLTISGVEADDTIGSIARWSAKNDVDTYLCSSDKDLYQLVNEKIKMLNTFKENLIIDREGVEKQFNVSPEKMIDFLAITGDASDNVPGLTGFGPKTAADLLNRYGSLDYILDHPKSVSGAKKQEILVHERERALMSRQLVTVHTTIPIPEDDHFYLIKPINHSELKEFFSSMNFLSLIKELDSSPSAVEGIGEREIPPVTDCELINQEEQLRSLIQELSKQREICIDILATEGNPIQANLIGVGLGYEASKAWYIPLNGQIELETVIKHLKPFLDNPDSCFYGHHLKSTLHVLENYGLSVRNISFDTILASYLLNSHRRQHSLEYLSLETFDKVKPLIQSLIGKGKNQIEIKDVSLDQITQFSGNHIADIIRLKNHLQTQLAERGLVALFEELELPLMRVLSKMERNGIFIDIPVLQTLSELFGKKIRSLEQVIYEMAGETFNLNSPKQLGVILFEKLGLKAPRKTATGYSTDADVLETLARQFPIAKIISEYRAIEKLRSTYIDALPKQVNPKTERIHCTFNQSGTATGRLACQDPNLQNIPVRTENGKLIREAFKPQNPGWSYIAADYSQIELRLLAHLSGDETLIKAFTSGEDIHSYTASLMFNIPIYEVTSEQRYQAKAVNFGIIYGQQAYGLAQELSIDTKIANQFIRRYFERYPKVRHYLDACIQSAKETGKAVTMFGRERLLPEIKNTNAFVRAAAERLALNTPLQGTQADLIKKAMLLIDQKLKIENKKAKMVLQIHDELIFEAPDEEVESIANIVQTTMEGVSQLKVPLVVEIHIGKNWKEC